MSHICVNILKNWRFVYLVISRKFMKFIIYAGNVQQYVRALDLQREFVKLHNLKMLYVFKKILTTL